MTDNFIFGIRTVIEAINSGKKIEKILFKRDLQGQIFNELFTLAKENNIPFQFVPVEKINKFTRKNHQGVIAYLSLIEFQDIEQITQMVFEQGKLPLFLILDGVTDVRNFGSIARSAECAGVQAIVIKSKGSAPVSNDAIKTSAGALFKIPVAKVNDLVKIIYYFKNSGLQIVAATEKAEDYHFKADFTLPTAIVMGAEDIGISENILNVADFKVKIPIMGEIASLNVSNAASVVIYEAVRQRLS